MARPRDMDRTVIDGEAKMSCETITKDVSGKTIETAEVLKVKVTIHWLNHLLNFKPVNVVIVSGNFNGFQIAN